MGVAHHSKNRTSGEKREMWSKNEFARNYASFVYSSPELQNDRVSLVVSRSEKKYPGFPTNPFAIVDLQNPSHDVPELHKKLTISWSRGSKGLSGSSNLLREHYQFNDFFHKYFVLCSKYRDPNLILSHGNVKFKKICRLFSKAFFCKVWLPGILPAWIMFVLF